MYAERFFNTIGFSLYFFSIGLLFTDLCVTRTFGALNLIIMTYTMRMFYHDKNLFQNDWSSKLDKLQTIVESAIQGIQESWPAALLSSVLISLFAHVGHSDSAFKSSTPIILMALFFVTMIHFWFIPELQDVSASTDTYFATNDRNQSIDVSLFICLGISMIGITACRAQLGSKIMELGIV